MENTSSESESALSRNVTLVIALVIGIAIMIVPFLIQAGYLPAVAG